MSNSETKSILLEIKRLNVEVTGKRLLRGVDMIVREGETHIVFGPNGSGKTTLVNAIMGLPEYKVVEGDILFRGDSILDWDLTARAKTGKKPTGVSNKELGKEIKPETLPIASISPVITGKINIETAYHIKLPLNFGLIPKSFQPSPAKPLNKRQAPSGVIIHRSIPRLTDEGLSSRTSRP
ncbi:MAG: ATP-binding cassette domain-containing protein [candidate division WOR-3 bacterium]